MRLTDSLKWLFPFTSPSKQSLVADVAQGVYGKVSAALNDSIPAGGGPVTENVPQNMDGTQLWKFIIDRHENIHQSYDVILRELLGAGYGVSKIATSAGASEQAVLNIMKSAGWAPLQLSEIPEIGTTANFPDNFDYLSVISKYYASWYDVRQLFDYFDNSDIFSRDGSFHITMHATGDWVTNMVENGNTFDDIWRAANSVDVSATKTFEVLKSLWYEKEISPYLVEYPLGTQHFTEIVGAGIAEDMKNGVSLENAFRSRFSEGMKIEDAARVARTIPWYENVTDSQAAEWLSARDFSAPDITDASIVTGTVDHGVQLKLTSSETGIVFFKAVEAGTAAPTAQEIRSSGHAPLTPGDNNIPVTGLESGKNYTVYYFAQDPKGNTATIQSHDTGTTDFVPPVAGSDHVTTPYNTEATVDVLANDTDKGTVTLTGVVLNQSGGVFEVIDGKIHFTPTPGFSGVASGEYGIIDQWKNISTGVVTVTVGSAPYTPPPVVDHASVVNAPTGTVTATTVNVTNSISDSDNIRNVTYYLYQADGTTQVDSNSTGSFTGLTDGTVYKIGTTAETYDPSSSTWTLKTSPLASVTTSDITPNAFDILNLTAQPLNTVVTTGAITVTGIDAATPVSTNLGTLVINGTDTGSASTIVSLDDTVAVRYTTGGTNSDTVSGTLTIGGVTDSFSITTVANHAPTASDYTYPTDVGKDARTFDVFTALNATDADNNTLTATVLTDGTKWSAVINGNNITYTANNGQTGTDTVTVRFSDGHGWTVDTVITFTGIDTQAPSTPSLTTTPSATNQDTVSVEVNGEVGASIWLNGSDSGLTIGATGKTWVPLDTSGAEGNKPFDIVLKDTIGNASSALHVDIAKDVTPPTTSSSVVSTDGDTSNGTGTAGYTNSLRVGITITDPIPSDVAGWFVSDSSTAPAASDAGWLDAVPTSYDIPAGADGTKSIYVYVKDAAGNVQQVGATSIILDTVAALKTEESFPNLDTVLATGSGTLTLGEDVHQVTDISFVNATDHSPAGGSASVTSGLDTATLHIDYTAPNVTDNDIQLKIVGTDLAGNTFTAYTNPQTLFAP